MFVFVFVCVCVCVCALVKWVIPCKISTAINMTSRIYVKILELLVNIDVSIHVNFVHSSC
jgi:hypothetical protein